MEKMGKLQRSKMNRVQVSNSSTILQLLELLFIPCTVTSHSRRSALLLSSSRATP